MLRAGTGLAVLAVLLVALVGTLAPAATADPGRVPTHAAAHSPTRWPAMAGRVTTAEETGVKGTVDRSPALQWSYAGAVLLGLLAGLVLVRQRPRPSVPRPERTTLRPDHDTPHALVAALVAWPGVGLLSGRAVPATYLSLVARGALSQELTTDSRGHSGYQVRLVDESRLGPDEVERAYWRALQRHASGGVVDADGVRKAATDLGPLKTAVRTDLRKRGWYDEHYRRAMARWAGLGVWDALLLAAGFALVTDDGWVVGVAAVVTLLALPAGVLLALDTPILSVAGRDAGQPWRAYKQGLRRADALTLRGLDLKTVRPDIVALNLVQPMRRTLRELEELEERPASGDASGGT